MAKHVASFKTDVDRLADYIENRIMQASSTASLEEKQVTDFEGVRCIILAFERFSYTGNSRVAMSVTLLGNQDEVHVVGISTGGSQAMFFKVNTWGEEAFLDTLRDALAEYQG